MDFNMITDRHNCDDGYISLVNISLDNLPDVIKIDNYTLLKKNEFHISLVCLKQLDKIFDPNVAAIKKKEFETAFLEFEKDHNLTEFLLTGEYRLVKRDNKVTVVAMVTVPNLNELFDTLRQPLGLGIPTQPTHITIYTLQPEAGIGLTSRQQVETESEAVDLPVLSDLQVK